MSKSTNVGFRLGCAVANLKDKKIDFEFGKAVKFDLGKDFIEIPAHTTKREKEIDR